MKSRWERWGLLQRAVAVVVAVFVALMVVGGIGAAIDPPKKASSTSATSSTSSVASKPVATSPRRRSTAARPSTCLSAHGGHADLGVAVAAFRTSNNTNQPSNPAPGDIAFTILKTSQGCVTAFRWDIWTRPNPTAELASASAGPQLSDAPTSSTSKTMHTALGPIVCMIWSSASLQRVTGDRYAVGLAEYPGVGDSAYGEITAWKTPDCNLPGSAFGPHGF